MNYSGYPGTAPDADPGDIEQCLNGGSCPTGTFPWVFVPGGFLNIQLDIVGFLAILGEATVLNNGQVAALNWTCFLPRLIPAPQALIRTSRPERLDPSSGVVVGPHSGNIRRHVNHIAHILHQVAFHKSNLGSPDLAQYHVRAIKIDWSEESTRDLQVAVQAGSPGANKTARDKGKIGHKKKKRLTARFQNFGPLAFLAYFGCAQSIGIFVYSIIAQDSMSLLATCILSLVSTLTGVANHWKLKLPERTETRNDMPASDVIISYPNGSFLVVTCPEEIARLYFQTEQCAYTVSNEWQYRTICLVGTIMLMLGVICLANATQVLQVIWACMYIAINAAYWGVAALPARMHWDMSSFKTDVVEFRWWDYEKDVKGRTFKKPSPLDLKETSNLPTFTESLWKAIGASGGSHWARVAEIAPDTTGWDAWLREAEEQLDKHHMGKSLIDAKMASHSVAAEAASNHALLENGDRSHSVVATEPKQLPDWNYREALTRCLKIPNRSRWSEIPDK